jgi:transcriptional regulator with XRE-family HTH domain
MKQPELGMQLGILRKEKNLTQEELVEKSNVSVRTIQRIENGEVFPRTSTVKILLEALGENYDSFSLNHKQNTDDENRILPNVNLTTLLVAMLSGTVYLTSQIILGVMDVDWFTKDSVWQFSTNAIYSGLTIIMVISFALLARGFISLSIVFENTLLKVSTYAIIVATTGVGILHASSLFMENDGSLLLLHILASIILGVLKIVLGIALISLQDGMGKLARLAGILEILQGCMLVTVILFFISFFIMMPTIVVEILILYRGYEYLSKSNSNNQ